VTAVGTALAVCTLARPALSVTKPATREHRHDPCHGKSAPSLHRSKHPGGVTARSCVRGTSKADSSVTASNNPGKHREYAVYQGRRGDAIPSGYVGVDNQHGLTLVGCDTGRYNPGRTDKWNQHPHSRHNNAQIAVSSKEFTAPTGPVGPGDPCSPFVPHTPPGTSCGSRPADHPAVVAPAGSPLVAYSKRRPTSAASARANQVGIAGDFGGGKGASGYLQLRYHDRGDAPTFDLATGGNSRGGGGTVAVGNDGRETDDPYTPAGSPVTICQD
jgi:hypothetical protein